MIPLSSSSFIFEFESKIIYEYDQEIIDENDPDDADEIALNKKRLLKTLEEAKI